MKAREQSSKQRLLLQNFTINMYSKDQCITISDLIFTKYLVMIQMMNFCVCAVKALVDTQVIRKFIILAD